MVVSSCSEPYKRTEKSVVRIKRLPTKTLDGKVRYRPSVSKARLSIQLFLLRMKSCFLMGLYVSLAMMT